jgi:hypothetical protein
MDLGGSRTLIPCVQDRGLTIRRQALRCAALTQGRPSDLCCEKGSNLHPRPSEGRAHPIELPQLRGDFSQWSGQDSNLQQAVSETAASSRLGYWTVFFVMHRAGLEPASLRLKIGGSPFELPVLLGDTIATHREGFEAPADSLEESCSSDRAAGAYRFEHRFLLQSMTNSYSINAPGRTRTCIFPLKKRGLCQLSDECICSKRNYLSCKCTGQDSNLHPSAS